MMEVSAVTLQDQISQHGRKPGFEVAKICEQYFSVSWDNCIPSYL